jgi:hypothetical protein
VRRYYPLPRSPVSCNRPSKRKVAKYRDNSKLRGLLHSTSLPESARYGEDRRIQGKRLKINTKYTVIYIPPFPLKINRFFDWSMPKSMSDYHWFPPLFPLTRSD